MSRVRINIDRLVLKGFDPAQQKALVEGLQGELSRLLGDPANRADWAQSRRTPVLRVGPVVMGTGTPGGLSAGRGIARGTAKALKR
jgi:hypothetical protein